MISPHYVMFFDHHTQKAYPHVGRDFHADEFAAELHRTGIDLVGFHAKCNQGFCYFATETGTRHPALAPGRDLFGEVVTECGKLGINVNAYFSCGLSYEDVIRHPEWTSVGLQGQIYYPEILESDISPYMRMVCLNSPYRDYLLKLIAEVRDNYPVTGFLFDSLSGFPCRCPRCAELMRREGLDPAADADVERFGKMSARRLASDIAALLEPDKNKYMYSFLGLGAVGNVELGGYLECECLPTVPCWGYDWLPLFSRYYRTLTDKTVLNMTGRFYDWGDFGSLRADAAIEYDLFFGLANAMRPNVGSHLHPGGKLNPAVVETLKRVFGKIRRYDRRFEGAAPKVDLALVARISDVIKPLPAAAVRLLSELRQQFDVIDCDADWNCYPLLVLPDDIRFDEKLTAKLQGYLRRGGKVVATGKSGLDTAGSKFVCEAEWGVRAAGELPCRPATYVLDAPYNSRVPAMPLATYCEGGQVEALPGTVVAGRVVAPAFNQGWDGTYSLYYTPPEQGTDIPCVTLAPQVSYCSWELFTGYYNSGLIHLRETLRVMLDRLLPRPLLRIGESFPAFGRAFVTGKPGELLVHLLSYLPELRGKMLIVEDELPQRQVRVALRLDGAAVARVVLAPEDLPLAYTVEDDYVTFTVPEFAGYAMIAVELRK